MSDTFQSELQTIVEQLEPTFRNEGQQDIDAVLRFGVGSYDDLLALLENPNADPELRSIAGWILARLGRSWATPALSAALNDQTTQVRRSAAQALGDLGDPQALQPLLDAASRDEDAEVRMFALRSLGLLGDLRAFEPLISRLVDQQETPKVRGMAAEALADLRDIRSVPPLIDALSDPITEVRFWAAFALGELGDPAAILKLKQLAAKDNAVLPGWWEVKREAASAIERILDKIN